MGPTRKPFGVWASCVRKTLIEQSFRKNTRGNEDERFRLLVAGGLIAEEGADIGQIAKERHLVDRFDILGLEYTAQYYGFPFPTSTCVFSCVVSMEG